MAWRTLRKTGTGIHVSYAGGYTNNLIASNTRLRTEPEFELSLDLNGNLRTRNRESSFSYIDARELADGEIEKLELVQLFDDQILERIQDAIEHVGSPESWILTIELENTHSFRVRPEFRTRSLFLSVESKLVSAV